MKHTYRHSAMHHWKCVPLVLILQWESVGIVSYNIYQREMWRCNHLGTVGMMGGTWICLAFMPAASSSLVALFVVVVWLLFQIKEWLIVNLVHRFGLVNLKGSKQWSGTAELTLHCGKAATGHMEPKEWSLGKSMYCPSFPCWLKRRAFQLP